MRDIRFIPNETDTVCNTDLLNPVYIDVRGTSTDTGLMLLQRLYVFMFTDNYGGYRGADVSRSSVLEYLDGANLGVDDAVNSLLGLACNRALSMLDSEDLALIDRFYGKCVNGEMTCTLILKDGTTIHGNINR